MNALFNRHKVPPDKLGKQAVTASVTKFARVAISTAGRSGVNSVNRTVLRLEELDFTPFCEITNKEAVSAIHRAKTQLCKQEIANITCLINDSNLYPKVLQMECPTRQGKFLCTFNNSIFFAPNIIIFGLSASCIHKYSHFFVGLTAGKSLGCFQDEKNLRTLNGYSVSLKTTNSPELCINLCLQSGFPYAGVEYS